MELIGSYNIIPISISIYCGTDIIFTNIRQYLTILPSSDTLVISIFFKDNIKLGYKVSIISQPFQSEFEAVKNKNWKVSKTLIKLKGLSKNFSADMNFLMAF